MNEWSSVLHSRNGGIGLESAPGERVLLFRAMDLPPFLTVVLFSLFSFIFPHTGTITLAGLVLSRGYVVGTMYLLALIPVWVLIRAERRYGGKILNFFRTFYPQILITPFFMESIRLSAQVFGGRSHDAFFASLDQRIFGFQPYIDFHEAFDAFPRFNELMFAAYFSYYLVIVTLLWIPWFLGNREETERAVFIYFGITLVVNVWYIFFRVQGPKYWIPELKLNWYDHFEGYLFVRFFKRMFNRVTLSGAAFPSSHALFTALCVVFGYRWDKRLLSVYLPALALIMLATVYIYAHYAVDILTGMALAPLLYLAVSLLYEPCRRLLSIHKERVRIRVVQSEAEPEA